jgi:3-deoxy-manno-octulosonate cytidylyltransferase (CMP-KDO synthetase)
MTIALIPARYDSKRFPGKPLIKFGNTTMIQMVYLKTKKSVYIDDVYVVTDDIRIKENIEQIGGKVLTVYDDCLNGTERICKAIKNNPLLFEDEHIIVNVQGDEPFINPNHIDIAISKMNRFCCGISKGTIDSIVCSTLHFKIENEIDLFNKSIGKLVLSSNDNILYCSRNCIPFNKEGKPDLSKTNYFGHIGLFVFKKDYLLDNFCEENTPLQLEEDIEWLKIIEQGYHIKSTCIKDYEIGVNTIEDYNYLVQKYKL